MKTTQESFWSGSFGREYTDRNTFSDSDFEGGYSTRYGKSKTDLNNEFLDGLDRDIKILEVGCNVGLQLTHLQKMGFTNLYGIELQDYAVEKAKSITQNINIIQGSGFDIPFRDSYFDMVYTSGVLIHISPADLHTIMAEMIRCTKKYIWGFEYYSEEPKEMNYRGHDGFLWKMDYAKEFSKVNANVKEVKRKIYPYLGEEEKGNEDIMYLLEIAK